MGKSVSELESHVADLELRLERYHEWLSAAVAERDRLALDAAWGVHSTLMGMLAFAGSIFVFQQLVGLEAWWHWVVAALLAHIAWGAAFSWSNTARMKEVDQLAKLPEWEWKDPIFD